jgi:hypothetical protein
LVLSCLGQAADLVVSTTRSSAVGIMLTPPQAGAGTNVGERLTIRPTV